MIQKKAESIGNILDKYFEVMGLKPKLKEMELISNWEKVAGTLMKRHTTSLEIVDRVLYVKVDSSIVRNELLMARDRLIKSLNESVNTNCIDNIIFR